MTPETMPPADQQPAKVAKLSAEHVRLSAERRSADLAVEAASAAVLAARDVDRDTAAAAIRAGKPMPGTPAEDKAARAETGARRHQDATALAVQRVEAELVEAVADAHDAWAASAVRTAAAATDAYRRSLTTLAAARQNLATARGVVAWLGAITTRPQTRYRDGTGQVQGLLGRNSEPMPFDEVAAALTADAAPLTPKVLPPPAELRDPAHVRVPRQVASH